jgi:predicted deacetylase
MRYILIRDDDINYFTKHQNLEVIYGKFFEKNLPLNFSVIPRTKCDLRVSDPRSIYRIKEHLDYEPFIPPDFRGKPEEFDIGENQKLVNFLKGLGNIEILQHGFKHELIDNRKEFEAEDVKDLDMKINNGRMILQKAFGAKINFFTPPWDYLSRTALARIKKAGFLGVSLYRIYEEIRPLFPQRLFAYREEEDFAFFSKLLIVKHPGYIFSRFNSRDEIIKKINLALKKAKILVIVNHHWEYFFDWSGRDEKFLGAWSAFTNDILGRDDVEFLNFSQLYSKLVS